MSPEQVPDTASVVDGVIRARRTSLLVDPEATVPAALIDDLIEAATWAPNHKRTWPWRFTVLTGDARARLGQAMAAATPELGVAQAKVDKLPGKYLRSPVVLLVWVVRDEDGIRAREDRDATAAAVQNLLLAATARGLGNYWATVPDVLTPTVRAEAGVGDRHDLVALVYLGWPTGQVSAPERPAPVVDRLT